MSEEIRALSREALLQLLHAYDEHIREALESGRLFDGWRPPGVVEFFHDWQQSQQDAPLPAAASVEPMEGMLVDGDAFRRFYNDPRTWPEGAMLCNPEFLINGVAPREDVPLHEQVAVLEAGDMIVVLGGRFEFPDCSVALLDTLADWLLDDAEATRKNDP